MKQHVITVCIIALACAMLACSSSSNDSHGNQKSELASLMRIMEKHGDEVKRALNTQQPLPEKPAELERLLTASPTPKMHIDEQTFPVFVSEYLQRVEELYEAPIEDQREVYNGLIQACENCHVVNCPGPLMKIEKMYVQLGAGL